MRNYFERALGPGFVLDHVYGHAGDPWNELVDMLAKREARSSFFLQRPAINIPHLRGKLPFLWMLFDDDSGIPQFSGQGFDVRSPALPPIDAPLREPERKRTSCIFEFNLSVATANILSMYNSENGFGGKLDYLRTQFVEVKAQHPGTTRSENFRRSFTQARSSATLLRIPSRARRCRTLGKFGTAYCSSRS